MIICCSPSGGLSSSIISIWNEENGTVEWSLRANDVSIPGVRSAVVSVAPGASPVLLGISSSKAETAADRDADGPAATSDRCSFFSTTLPSHTLQSIQTAAAPFATLVRVSPHIVVAPSSADGTLAGWNTATGQLLFSLQHVHFRPIRAVVSTGTLLVTGADDALVRVWALASLLRPRTDVAAPPPLLSLSAHTLPVTGIAVLGDRVYSVSLDATLKVHDIGAAGQLVANVDLESAASAVAVSQTGGRIYVGRVDGTVVCFSTFQLHQGPPQADDRRSVVLTPDGTTDGHVSVTSLVLTTNEALLIAGTSDGQCIVLDALTLHEVRRHRDHVGGGGIAHLAVTDLPPFELFTKRRGGAAQAPAPLRRFADPDPAHALASFQVPPQLTPQFM